MNLSSLRRLGLAAALAAALLANAPAAAAAPGDLDPTFGSGGTVELAWPDEPGAVLQVARLVGEPISGRLVVSTQFLSGRLAHGLARLHPDGTLDAGFGGDGFVLPDLDVDGRTAVLDPAPVVVALQGGGLVLAYLVQDEQFNTSIALARLTAGGSPDPTFGSGGKVLAAGLGTGISLSDAVVAADGRIYVALLLPDQATFAVARFSADGTLDPRYGRRGVLETQLGDAATLHNLTALAGGGLVSAGQAIVGGAGDYGLARHLPDGRLDRRFGRRGTVVLDVSGTDEVAVEVLPRADGSLLVAGLRAVDGSTEGDTAATLVRLHPDGTLDTGFGGGGEATFDPTPGPDGFGGVAQAPGDKLAAVVHLGDGRGAQLARFDAGTGALDPGFGVAGMVPLAGIPAGPVVTGAGDLVVAVGDPELSQRILVRRYLGG